MKVLFLDIDGVVNCESTRVHFMGFIGIDPRRAAYVRHIVAATGCEIVLSSTWRYHEQDREEVRRKICDFLDVTPSVAWSRGGQIAAWLADHPEVTRYAILDDDTDILPSQQTNWFQTFWKTGLTQQVVDSVILHLSLPSDAE